VTRVLAQIIRRGPEDARESQRRRAGRLDAGGTLDLLPGCATPGVERAPWEAAERTSLGEQAALLDGVNVASLVLTAVVTVELGRYTRRGADEPSYTSGSAGGSGPEVVVSARSARSGTVTVKLATRWLKLSPSALQPCLGGGEEPDGGAEPVRGRLGSVGRGSAGGR